LRGKFLNRCDAPARHERLRFLAVRRAVPFPALLAPPCFRTRRPIPEALSQISCRLRRSPGAERKTPVRKVVCSGVARSTCSFGPPCAPSEVTCPRSPNRHPRAQSRARASGKTCQPSCRIWLAGRHTAGWCSNPVLLMEMTRLHLGALCLRASRCRRPSRWLWT